MSRAVGLRCVVSTYLTPDTLREVDREATRRQTTRTAVIRDAIERAVKVWQTAFVVADEENDGNDAA